MSKKKNEVKFGSYEGKPIRWIVLEKTDQKALLLSKHCLFHKPYHDDIGSVTWEDCSLRKWLNEAFYNAAFTPDEKKQILTVKLKNANNLKCGTNGGNDTEDKIFLLSIDEVNKYFSSDDERAATFPEGGLTWWWLRSPGGIHYRAVLVRYDGSVCLNGYCVYLENDVRLALWVDLDSDIVL